MTTRTIGYADAAAFGTRSAGLLQQQAQRLMARVYACMGVGLLVTACTTLAVANSPALIDAMSDHPWPMLCVVLLQIGMAGAFMEVVRRCSFGVCTLMMTAYAMVDGVTLSWVFLRFSPVIITATLFVCAATFAVMGAWAAVFEKDLGSMRSYAGMGLVGVSLSALVMVFMPEPIISFLIGCAGVGTFMALTACDANRVRQEFSHAADPLEHQRAGMAGALIIYLDFVHQFVQLFRLLGTRK